METGGSMFGKRQKRAREGLAAATLLFEAAKANDQDRVLELLTGDETTDDGLAQALMLFWGIAAEVPTVRERLEEVAQQVSDEVRPAFETSFAVLDTGNQHLFRPRTATAQMTFISVIVKVIADDPEGELLLRQMVGLS